MKNKKPLSSLETHQTQVSNPPSHLHPTNSDSSTQSGSAFICRIVVNATRARLRVAIINDSPNGLAGFGQRDNRCLYMADGTRTTHTNTYQFLLKRQRETFFADPTLDGGRSVICFSIRTRDPMLTRTPLVYTTNFIYPLSTPSRWWGLRVRL